MHFELRWHREAKHANLRHQSVRQMPLAEHMHPAHKKPPRHHRSFEVTEAGASIAVGRTKEPSGIPSHLRGTTTPRPSERGLSSTPEAGKVSRLAIRPPPEAPFGNAPPSHGEAAPPKRVQWLSAQHIGWAWTQDSLYNLGGSSPTST